MHSNSLPRPRVPVPWPLCLEPSLAVRLNLVSHPLLWPYGAAVSCGAASPDALLTPPLPAAAPLLPSVIPAASVLNPLRTTPARAERGTTDGSSWTPVGVRGGDPRPEVTLAAVRPVGSTADAEIHRELVRAPRTATLKFGVSAILGTDREDDQEDRGSHTVSSRSWGNNTTSDAMPSPRSSMTAAAATAHHQLVTAAAATAYHPLVTAATGLGTTPFRLTSVLPLHSLAERLPFLLGRRRRSLFRRPVFSETQRQGLESRFQAQKYISRPDRARLAQILALEDSQVKIWFQNRRMKWRNSKERELLASGGSREQTLPTRANPHPDLTDVTTKNPAVLKTRAKSPPGLAGASPVRAGQTRGKDQRLDGII